jgi:preprotein translocase subunit SecE
MLSRIRGEVRVAKASAKGRKRKENAIVRYLKETRAELRKVTWPSREEAVNLTVIVVAVTTAMAVFLGVVDWLFAKLFGLIIR